MFRNYEFYNIEKDNSISNLQNKKSSDLDENLRSNRCLKMEEKFNGKID